MQLIGNMVSEIQLEDSELARLMSMRTRKRETSSERASMAISRQVQQTASGRRGVGKKTFTDALKKLRNS